MTCFHQSACYTNATTPPQKTEAWKSLQVSLYSFMVSYWPGGSDGKASAYNAGDLCSIPGSGSSPGEGNGSPLQYFCLENLMDRRAWQATVHGVTKSQTRQNDFTSFTSLHNVLVEVWLLLGKLRLDDAGVTELEPVDSRQSSLQSSCLPLSSLFSSKVFSWIISRICQYISDTCVLIAKLVLLSASHFEDLLKFSEHSGKELADSGDFLD